MTKLKLVLYETMDMYQLYGKQAMKHDIAEISAIPDYGHVSTIWESLQTPLWSMVFYFQLSNILLHHLIHIFQGKQHRNVTKVHDII